MMVALNLNPDARTLRQFGVIAVFGFGLLGAAAHFERFLFDGLGDASTSPVAVGLWGVGAISGLLALVYPPANRGLFIFLSVVTYPIGLVVSFVVLGILVFRRVRADWGALLRATGRDPMVRGFDRSRSSYWDDTRRQRDKASYFRQF